MSDTDSLTGVGTGEPVTVTIYGVTYSLQGDIDAEYASMLARYVDSKMWELSEEGSITSSTKLAVMTALNIAEEYFKLTAARQKETEYAQKHLSRMTKKLDSVINESLFPDGE